MSVKIPLFNEAMLTIFRDNKSKNFTLTLNQPFL